MKKVLSALVLSGLLVMPAVALAACDTHGTESACINADCMWNPNTNKCQGTSIGGFADVIDLVEEIGNWIFAALLVVAVIFLIIAGFLWVTAGGNAEQTTRARQMLINALIGVAIALGARGLIAIVTDLIS